MEPHILTDRGLEQDLTRKIEEKAAAYAPEWRFDTEQPDVGTAIACIFARMHQGTLEQYNRVPQKLTTEFFNEIQTSMKPSSPASGYVSFGLVNNTVEGTEVLKGTVLTTEVTDKEGEPIPLETRDDLYVSPVEFAEVYQSYDQADYIGKVYQAEEEYRPFSLFGFEEANLQSHELYIGHSKVFAIKSGAKIELTFEESLGKPVENRFLQALADPGQAVFSYSLGEGYTEFEEVKAEDGKLCLIKRQDQLPWGKQELEGVEKFWLRCRLIQTQKLKDFSFRRLSLSSMADFLLPDAVLRSGAELPLEECLPFGEQFSIYDEVYFASDEAFTKGGAFIRLSFHREFIKIPLAGKSSQAADWKLIMRRNQFQVEREYDITIGEVIWEYYNGSGWVRLFKGREYGDVFGIDTGISRQKVTLVFSCPKDMAPILVGGVKARYIRARIWKVNNAFKTQGQYISPVISNIRMGYQYPLAGVEAEYLAVSNNLEKKGFPVAACLGKAYPFYPFTQPGDKEPALYLGSVKPWENGPIRILWEVKEGTLEKMPPLCWEYYTCGRWKELNPADGTENFKKTGLLTFSSPGDLTQETFFGRRLFWLRVRGQAGAYGGERHRANLPVIEGWHYNSVPIWSVQSNLEETFSVENYGEEVKLTLSNRGIQSINVWVNETGTLGKKEKDELKKTGRLKETLDDNGQVKELWVLWEMADSFSFCERDSRCYLLDANEGVVTFGDGNKGKKPAVGITGGIRISYSIGCGAAGNLKAGDVTGLDLSIGYINQITNPLALAGGYDRETAGEAMARRAGELKHRFRAVTPSDYEKLAKEASGAVERAACLRSVDERGRKRPGHVTLLLLQKNFETESYFFPKLKEEVARYMEDKIPAGMWEQRRFHIVPPQFVEIGISADIWVEDYNQIFACRRQIEERLAAFLHPIHGNFMGNGWATGKLPGRSQVDTCLKAIPLIRDIRNLAIAGRFRQGGSVIEMNPEDRTYRPFVLPVCGSHRIRIHTE